MLKVSKRRGGGGQKTERHRNVKSWMEEWRHQSQRKIRKSRRKEKRGKWCKAPIRLLFLNAFGGPRDRRSWRKWCELCISSANRGLITVGMCLYHLCWHLEGVPAWLPIPTKHQKQHCHPKMTIPLGTEGAGEMWGYSQRHVSTDCWFGFGFLGNNEIWGIDGHTGKTSTN